MKRLFPILLVVLLIAPMHAEGKPALLAKVPPLDPIIAAIEVADELTAKNSSQFEAMLQQAERQPKLLVATEEFDVTQTETKKIWRGSVSLTLTLPCRVSYTINLANLQTSSYDPQQHILTVRMADPEIEAVELMFERRQQPKMEYTRFCFNLLDSESELDLSKQALDHCRPNALAMAKQRTQAIRSNGEREVQEYLRNLLDPVVPGIRVIVD